MTTDERNTHVGPHGNSTMVGRRPANSTRVKRMSTSTIPEAETTREMQLELQILQLRDELIGAEAKLGELRSELARRDARYRRIEDLALLRVAHTENEIALGKMYRKKAEMMERSTTWRIGRMFVVPFSWLKRPSRP